MLSNKLALVTGAASGIGLAVAKSFAIEGANVCMVDLQEEALVERIKDLKIAFQNKTLNHSYYKCDVSVKEQVENLFKEIIEKYSETPTIIVNSAGILILKLFIDSDETDFDRLMNVNLKGTFLVSNLAAKKLVENYKNAESPQASIINISSFSAKSSMDYVSVYGASKAGVESLSRSIGRELGKYNIRCNSILPGGILTPMVMNARQPTESGCENTRDNFVSLGRFGKACEVAQLCLFLASEMSSYITGASIECSGGMYS